MPKYRCIVATPTASLYAGDVEYADIPGTEGNFGVLANHEQYVGLTRPGVLTLKLDESGTEKKFAVYRGIAQMFNNHLSVLVRLGRALDEIDVAETKAKMDEAKAELDEIVSSDTSKADDAQIKTRREYIEWCDLQIRLAQGEVI